MRVAFVFVSLFATSAAAVPTTVTYAGVLTRAGQPVDDLVDVRFSLHDAPSGGAEVYSEQQTGIVVIGGELVAELGQDGLDDSVLDTAELFLQISVDGDVLEPRVRISSVPYALRAEAALIANDTVSFGGLGPEGYVTVDALAAIAGTGLTFSSGVLSVADGGITTTQLATAAVQSANLGDLSVTTAKLADSSVTTAKLADSSVTGLKIALNAVAGAQIIDATIRTADIADGQITTLKIATGAVGSAQLAPSSVGTTQIADGSINAGDLGTNSVGRDEIANLAVDTDELASSAVTRSKIDGVEVDVFRQAIGCGSGLTTSTTCLTQVCNVVGGVTTFKDCDGSCDRTAPIGCSSLPLAGRLLSATGL